MMTRADAGFGGRKNGHPRLIVALLLVLLYFMAYRYPLQINSSVTSPTYADTPALLSVAKFILIMVVALLYAGRAGPVTDGRPLRWAGPTVPFLAAGAVWFIGKGILLASDILAEMGFFFIVALIWLIRAREFSRESVEKVLLWFTAISIAVEVLQYSLFVAVGRLPALAYEGTISIRFGSVWDDPNGFAFVIALVFPICLTAIRNRFLSALVQTALLAMLFLTQSLTGIACVLCAIGGARLFVLSRRSPTVMIVAMFSALLVTYFTLTRLLTSDFFAEFIDLKQGSIAGHATGSSAIQRVGWVELMGMSLGPVEFNESGWLTIATYLGVPGVLIVLGFGFLAISSAAQLARQERKPLWEGCMAFFLAVLVGTANLPLLAIFPINGLFILLGTACIAAAGARARAVEPVNRGKGGGLL